MATSPLLGSGGKVLLSNSEAARYPPAASDRASFLPQVAGFQKLDPPLAYTARSGVESQQDDAGIAAELVLVRLSKAAHPREQDADTRMRMCRRRRISFIHVRTTHLLEALWAAMLEGSCTLGERRCRAARRVTVHFNIMEAGVEIFKDFTAPPLYRTGRGSCGPRLTLRPAIFLPSICPLEFL
jgi:hypothetical protein